MKNFKDYQPSQYLRDFYKKSLKLLRQYSVYKLVNIFNKETSHNGWVGPRGAFLKALSDSLEEQGIDLSEVKSENAISFRYPVYLDQNNKLRQIKKDW